MRIFGTNRERRVAPSVEFRADEEIAQINFDGTIETDQEAEITNGSRKTLVLLIFHMAMSIFANILGSNYIILTGTVIPKFDLNLTMKKNMNGTINTMIHNETEAHRTYKLSGDEVAVFGMVVTICMLLAGMARFIIIRQCFEPAQRENVNVKLMRRGFLFTFLIILAAPILYAIYNPLQMPQKEGPNNTSNSINDRELGNLVELDLWSMVRASWQAELLTTLVCMCVWIIYRS